MHCVVIAEAGVNHNGSLDRALDLVDAAALAGADIVKFQTFRAHTLARPGAAKAGYQNAMDDSPDQVTMLRRLELGPEAHTVLAARCVERGIEFLSTPFDLDSLSLLVGRIGVRRIKIGSGDLTNGPLLLAAARSGLPVILSTGMASLAEVEAGLGILAFGIAADPSAAPSRAAFASAYADAGIRAGLDRRVSLLHCTTEYPTPLVEANLRAMDTLGAAFGLPVGYSDHTDGIALAIAAAARGATIVEKHFTLDRNLPGPDHKASLAPEDLAAMVAGIRAVAAGLGDGRKVPSPSELGNIPVVRRSLVAARAIRVGTVLTAEDLAIKRPGTGRSPMEYWDRLGRVADRDYEQDEQIH